MVASTTLPWLPLPRPLTVRKWFAENGYDSKMGARPLARLIDNKLKSPLSRKVLFGDLQNGGRVNVQLQGSDLVFDITELPKPLSKEEKKALYDDLTDVTTDINDKDFKDKASYAKAMKDAKTKVYKKHGILENTDEALYQGPSVKIGAGGGLGGKRFIPSVTVLSRDAVDAINAKGAKRLNWGKPHIKIVKSGEGVKLLISKLFLSYTCCPCIVFKKEIKSKIMNIFFTINS